MLKILCPTDLTDHTSNSLIYANDLAKKSDTEIIVLHSFFIPPPLPAGTKVKSPEDVYHYGQKMLQERCEEFVNQYISSETQSKCIVRRGFVLEEILKVIKEENIDIIFMNTEGAHGLKELFPGTITSKIIENVLCPVLVIPENHTFHPLDDIVYATDMKGNEKENISFAFKFASIFNAKVTFLNISKKLTPKEQEAFKAKMSEEASVHNYQSIDFVIIESSNVFDALTNFVESNDSKLLILSTRKRPVYQRLFQKSLTRRMAHHAFVPVLAMHKE
ncbi:universal stress protein [Cytophagaceae bacterium ABcell3]|nr:universal stress protein [Cytophagaceae bacterium ABcell3]